MTDEKVVSWKEGCPQRFISFEDGDSKVVSLTDWRLRVVDNKFKQKPTDPDTLVEFASRVCSVDGEDVDAELNTLSSALKYALRDVLEAHKPSEEVSLSITRVGKGNATKYNVKFIGVIPSD